MTSRWNVQQPRSMKRAFVAVNAVEIAVIACIMILMRLGTKAPPIVIPDPDVQIIRIQPVDIAQPPTIEEFLPAQPAPMPDALASNIGVPVPVPDPQATD